MIVQEYSKVAKLKLKEMPDNRPIFSATTIYLIE